MLAATTCLALIQLAVSDAPAAKLPAELAQEMADAVVAIDKVLGLESWAAHGNNARAKAVLQNPETLPLSHAISVRFFNSILIRCPFQKRCNYFAGQR